MTQSSDITHNPPTSTHHVSKFDGRRILLIVSGGIAAYKACHFVRLIRKSGGNVRVVMTCSAEEFVKPLSFATLSGEPVFGTMFPSPPPAEPVHLTLAGWGDAVVVAPATANIIGKMANGIADDLASSIMLAVRKSLLIAPAMNSSMWLNQAVQRNVKLLKDAGISFVGPEAGDMAGVNEEPGIGRMSEPEDIMDALEALLSDRARWEGKRILVTTGPTRESIDPVRFISNRSSGKMGDAIARAAYLRGADVTLVRGPSLKARAPNGVRVVKVETAAEMAEEIKKQFAECDALFMAAAVADWTPEKVATSKLKKKEGLPRIPWRKTEDILSWAGKNRKDQAIMGFALETEHHLAEAKLKLIAKKADIIALNDATKVESVFGGDTIQLTLLRHEGEPEELPILSKAEAAERLLDALEPLLEMQV